MWTKPGYRPADAPSAPAREDDEQIMATLRRPRGEELRVSLAHYEGHPYISLRVWGPGVSGKLLPMKGKGCTVRLKEARQVADALRQALALVEPEPAPARGQVPDRRPERKPAPDMGDEPY